MSARGAPLSEVRRSVDGSLRPDREPTAYRWSRNHVAAFRDQSARPGRSLAQAGERKATLPDARPADALRGIHG